MEVFMNGSQDKVSRPTTMETAARDRLKEPVHQPAVWYSTGAAALIASWWLIYSHLEPFAGFITQTLSRWAGFSPTGHLDSAIRFFVFETPKVLLLLTLVVFGVGIEKNKNFELERSEIEQVKAAVKRVANQSGSVAATPTGSGCRCSSGR
jgi:hypothetical protein